MKLLAQFCGVAALCFASCSAFADVNDDFKMDVLDPPTFGQSYPVYIIDSTSFQVTFSPCLVGELPNGLTGDGCFAGVNNSGKDWIGLDMIFPNTSALASQPASCAPAASDNIYSDTDCFLSQDGARYLLGFAGGVIPSYPNTPGDQFFIVETGVDWSLFPTGDVQATVATVTPEPASAMLLLTGVSVLGPLCRSGLRRRVRR